MRIYGIKAFALLKRMLKRMLIYFCQLFLFEIENQLIMNCAFQNPFKCEQNGYRPVNFHVILCALKGNWGHPCNPFDI